VEHYDIEQGNNRIPDIRDVPYLDVVAALNEAGDRLTLFCVNRHLYRDLPAAIRLSGFAPSGRASVKTLAGTSIHQPNDEMRPEAVHPVESVAPAAPEFEYTFPRSSVTVLEMAGGR
jgi:alpha-L-arabinofuranosidase